MSKRSEREYCVSVHINIFSFCISLMKRGGNKLLFAQVFFAEMLRASMQICIYIRVFLILYVSHTHFMSLRCNIINISLFIWKFHMHTILMNENASAAEWSFPCEVCCARVRANEWEREAQCWAEEKRRRRWKSDMSVKCCEKETCIHIYKETYDGDLLYLF